MPSGQSVNQFPARLAEPNNLARDDFSGRGCGIRLAPGGAAAGPVVKTAGND